MEQIDFSEFTADQVKKIIEAGKKSLIKKEQELLEVRSDEPLIKAIAEQIREVASIKKSNSIDILEAVAKNLKIKTNLKRKKRAELAIKYQNPSNPSENWKGVGKTPLWLSEQLNAGKDLSYFLIS